MATVAASRITNIVSVVHGDDTYEGVRSVMVRAETGRLLPILKEGHLYPTGLENVGTPEFPVTVEVVFEQDEVNMLALLAAATGDLVVTYKRAGGASNQVLTIKNVKFQSKSHSQTLQDFGRPSISGVSYSADGTTFPATAANAS